MKRALVLGGSGVIGREVVRGLVSADIQTSFTYHSSQDVAADLTRETGAGGIRLDLADAAAIRATLRALESTPNVVVHCAAVARPAKLSEISDADWQAVLAINCHSALITAQELAPRMQAQGGGSIVLLGGLDRGQSLPIPITYAASQGALGALTDTLAKELGPSGILVNLIALGLLESGLSQQLDPALREQYETFSAFGRPGRPSEVVAAVLWLALRNTYMTGRTLQLNGGI